MKRTKRTALRATDEFYNEKGEQGITDAFFFVDHGRYSVVMLAEKRGQTPKGRTWSCRANVTYQAPTAKALASALVADGWGAPENLAELCEKRPSAVPRRKRKAKPASPDQEQRER